MEIVGWGLASESLEDQNSEAPDVGGFRGAVVMGSEVWRLEGGHVVVGVGFLEEREKGVIG